MATVTRKEIEEAFASCGIPGEWLDATYAGKSLTNWEMYLIGDTTLSKIALAYLKDGPI